MFPSPRQGLGAVLGFDPLEAIRRQVLHQQPTVGRVVIRHQDPGGGKGNLRNRGDGLLPDGGPAGYRQGRQDQGKDAALSGRAGQPDLAAHQRREPPADAESEPGAAITGGVLAPALGEQMENLLLLIGRDAWSRVRHRDAQMEFAALF
ncbi:hypothetical protein RZS08_26785, partial [Arthrospira platensis SPKY1]|nr:hypothetical protein [Arthrospira platensis SPKY1]